MQISSKWLLLSWGPGLAHFPQCLLVQLEHLHAPPKCWVSANWCNEAVSLWGWAVLNKQEQRGTVLHGASSSIWHQVLLCLQLCWTARAWRGRLQKRHNRNSKHQQPTWKQTVNRFSHQMLYSFTVDLHNKKSSAELALETIRIVRPTTQSTNLFRESTLWKKNTGSNALFTFLFSPSGEAKQGRTISADSIIQNVSPLLNLRIIFYQIEILKRKAVKKSQLTTTIQ